MSGLAKAFADFSAGQGDVGLPMTHDSNSIPGTDPNDPAMAMKPSVMQEGMQTNADPKNITDDSGNIVGYDAANAFKQWGQKQYANAGSGSILGFIKGLMGSQSIADTPMTASPGTATSATMDKKPIAQQKQDYSSPILLPPAAIPQARASILKQSGLNPESYSTPASPAYSSVPGADILRKGMTTGDVRGKMYNAADEMDEITNAVRKPQEQNQLVPNRYGKPANLQSAYKRKTSITGD